MFSCVYVVEAFFCIKTTTSAYFLENLKMNLKVESARLGLNVAFNMRRIKY